MSFLYRCPSCGTPTHFSVVRTTPELCSKCSSAKPEIGNGNEPIDSTTLRPWDSVTERDAYIADQRAELKRVYEEMSGVKQEREKQERDEAREALREILKYSHGGTDKIVLLAKLGAISGIAESALNHLEDVK